MIHQAKRKGVLHGIRICRGAPQISHLLCANDCFLFCRATENEVEAITYILKVYEIASAQAINLNKSTVLLSTNTSENKCGVLSNRLAWHAFYDR